MWKINGWYDDSENNRWEAHGVTEEEDHIVLVESGTYSEAFAIKAAHDKIKGKVISKYFKELSLPFVYREVFLPDTETETSLPQR